MKDKVKDIEEETTPGKIKATAREMLDRMGGTTVRGTTALLQYKVVLISLLCQLTGHDTA